LPTRLALRRDDGTAERFETMFREMDADGSGRVDFEEFFAYFRRLKKERAAEIVASAVIRFDAIATGGWRRRRREGGGRDDSSDSRPVARRRFRERTKRLAEYGGVEEVDRRARREPVGGLVPREARASKNRERNARVTIAERDVVRERRYRG
jgi:hypothetical protein